MAKILYNNKVVNKQYTNGNIINKIPFQVDNSITIKSPEYLERTASANGYIGLGEYFTSDTVIEIDFQMTQAKGNAIIGDYGSNDNDDWRLFLNYDSADNNQISYDFINSRIYYNTGDWSKRFHLEIGNYYIKDLVSGNYWANSTSKSGFSRPNQMYLFHMDGTQITNNIDYGKVYSLKIKKNNVLVKDFIPYTDMNGNYGLYDKVSNTVFSSTGQMTGSSTINDVVIGSSSGTIYWQYAEMGSPTPPEPHDYSEDYLTFVAETNNVSISYIDTNSNTLQYSVDSGSTWNNLSNGQSTTAINNGEKILFKGTSLTVGGEVGIGTIRPSASASIEGNVMSLCYGDNFTGQTTIPNNFQLRKLFSGATNVTSAENLVLPATTLKKQCYSQMFQGCTSLVTAPKKIGEASMTWNGDYIMSDMFHGCTSLVNAPQLPSTTLGLQCYWYMFEDCTSMETAPELPAPTWYNQCYNGMFKNCSSLNYIKCLLTSPTNFNEWTTGVAASGTFVRYPNAAWGRGASGIPSGWSVVNNS